MFPRRLKQDPRILSLTLLITFISAASFFSAIMFWPTQSFNVYGHDPVQVGLRNLPGGIAILVGACITLWMLSVFRGRNKEMVIFSTCIMTAGGVVSSDVDTVLIIQARHLSPALHAITSTLFGAYLFSVDWVLAALSSQLPSSPLSSAQMT